MIFCLSVTVKVTQSFAENTRSNTEIFKVRSFSVNLCVSSVLLCDLSSYKEKIKGSRVVVRLVLFPLIAFLPTADRG